MGTLYVIATPIGNLQDISKRALTIMENVSFILCEDTRVSIKILNHYNIKKKLVSYHKFNEEQKLSSILEKLENGEDIAIISDAGTPLISDPGYLLVKACRERGIKVIGIPGPSAIITALSIAGINTTNFSFYGFLSTNNRKFENEIEGILASKVNAIVLYESPKRIVKLVEKLITHFPNSKLFIASDLTKLHERSFYGLIEEVYKEISRDPNIEKGEYVLVLEKEYIKDKKEEEMSYECLLIDTIIKEKVTMKEAINIVSKKKKIAKNILYNASLKIKEIIK